MDNENQVAEETLDTPEEEVETPETATDNPEEPVEEPKEDVEALKKKAEVAENYKVRAEKAEKERKALENKLNRLNETGEKPALGVNDYIDISASLEGLDQREKEYLSQMHTQTGEPLAEIRKGEDYQLWQKGYRDKVEKENALKPSSAQGEVDKPMSLAERLQNASLDEKEKILAEQGLWKNPRPKADRVHIGDKGLR